MAAQPTESLRPGAALFRTGDGSTALRDAEGELFDLALPADAADRICAALQGKAADPEELAAFRAAGHLGARRHWPAERRRIGLLVTGSRPVAAAMMDAVVAAGACPVELPGEVSVAGVVDRGVAAVSALHDGAAPEWWSRLDALPEHGIAWQRVSREGRHVLLEPIAAHPGDVGHVDVRARRLAAAGSGHRHLSAYWQQSATGRTITGEELLDAGECRLVASLVTHDLATWAIGTASSHNRLSHNSFTPTPLPANRRLRVVDLDGGAIADHPVLPVPACAE
ncbi:hypothetical protein ABZ863_19170 [Saccharomonospora sp. NPDC046836]|uniref:hypothetical protein n=1 Tax=Saccharomonospora sp. NPDC046836 TaxID=3156921 RepID=UPI00340DF547